LAKTDLLVVGASGQPKCHPGLAALTSARREVARLLDGVGTTDESWPAATPTAKQRQARKAAHHRWDAHRERRAVLDAKG
jgi:hypothetical protein